MILAAKTLTRRFECIAEASHVVTSISIIDAVCLHRHLLHPQRALADTNGIVIVSERSPRTATLTMTLTCMRVVRYLWLFVSLIVTSSATSVGWLPEDDLFDQVRFRS